MLLTTTLVSLLCLISPNSIKTSKYHDEHSIQYLNDIKSWELFDLLGDINQDPYTKPTPLIVVEAGYNIETHEVVTKDGYILTVHRIPNYSNTSAPVVFLQHGLMSSSADWVLTGPDHALAFLLADAGYDVWMGNFRGNTYSKNHMNHDISKQDYWRFTWDEHAEFDLSAMLSHMLEVSHQTSFYYIGHSMGTLSYFTSCNYHSWICDQTKLMVGYGPHTAVPHLKSPLFRILALFAHDLDWILNEVGLYEFGPSNWLIKLLADEVCDRNTVARAVCEDVLFLIAGFNKNEMNSTMVPYIVGHTPAGTSTLNMLHYSQSVTSGLWAGYDWGDAKLNMDRWNSSKPPEYRYDMITSPVALYWSDNDWLVVPRDVQTLAQHLNNLVLNYEMKEKSYTHLDFLWGIHNYNELYQQTLELIAKY